MRKWTLSLTLYFCLCLLAGCAAGNSTLNSIMPSPDSTAPTQITCRVVERAEDGMLILAKENGGFGDVYTLNWEDDSIRAGDLVVFTDVTGEAYYYEVVLLETLPPVATEEMITSGFALSLYTCTPGGGSRVTVRCARTTPEK